MLSGPRLILVSNWFKFTAGVQFFELRMISRGKPGLKNSFPRSDSRCGDILGEAQGEVGVQGHPIPQLLPVPCRYSTFCRMRLYPGLGLDNTFFGKNCKIFFKKTKPKTFVFDHIKAYQDSWMYSKNKWGITFYTNHETPCIITKETMRLLAQLLLVLFSSHWQLSSSLLRSYSSLNIITKGTMRILAHLLLKSYFGHSNISQAICWDLTPVLFSS